jgi:hypothetical protein
MEAGGKERNVGIRTLPLELKKSDCGQTNNQENTRLTPVTHGWPLTTSVEHIHSQETNITELFKKFLGLYEKNPK